MATLHRPPAAGPTAPRTLSAAHSHPRCSRTGPTGQRLAHRIQHRSGIAGLVRVHRDHHIVVQGIPPGHRGLLARRAMQLRAAQMSFEPRHGKDPTGWHIVRKPDPKPAGRRLRSQPHRGPLNATDPAHCHPGQIRNAYAQSGGSARVLPGLPLTQGDAGRSSGARPASGSAQCDRSGAEVFSVPASRPLAGCTVSGPCPPGRVFR